MTGIVIDGISKRFRIDKHEVEALRDIRLTLPSGSFTALTGPSGAESPRCCG